ncbi:glucose-1-phosphate adenylyltransferase subunit GlgD [Heyndrickxia sp. NPDC080065]|uniref:glucose-1-phosphate adenylyltransferase subunit GlgD n=1 Tax=Heyndrickxia sp. NPDC080065 TaxID=3390568 RepID=UPI003D024055
MTNVLGVINLINEKQFLKQLTYHRCLASVPFAGRYRMIDFMLSNFIHSQVTQVAVFTKEKYRSIMDHLGSGKEWDLDRRNGGLFVLPPIHQDKKIKGDLEQFYDHFEIFSRSSADTVIIAPGHLVCKIDFDEVLSQHKKNRADVTVIYKEYQGKTVEKPLYHKCTLNIENNVTDIELYTAPKSGEPVCLEIFVIDKFILMELIHTCVENEEFDLLKDAIKANLNRLNIKGYHFTGNMPFINSIDSYYTSNMEFLDQNMVRSFFYDKWDIFTKVKHEAPAKYSSSSKVSNSLIANGCDIQGIVENSIIFRGVKVQKGAVVKDSIIMQKGMIEAGAHVENIIADKQVKITKGKVLIGDLHPKVIKKAEII